ncbi:MAG: hypothetical protein V7707_11285 [Motiliproteus sp.]
MKLSKDEATEMNKFDMVTRFLSCDVISEAERLTVWHNLKDKGLIRFKGNQGQLQFFERVL